MSSFLHFRSCQGSQGWIQWSNSHWHWFIRLFSKIWLQTSRSFKKHGKIHKRSCGLSGNKIKDKAIYISNLNFDQSSWMIMLSTTFSAIFLLKFHYHLLVPTGILDEFWWHIKLHLWLKLMTFGVFLQKKSRIPIRIILL